MAATLTALFISIAIPMVIILDFMIQYLHVQPSISIPTIQCFDEDTMIGLKNGSYKKIKDIHIGDNLLSLDNNNNIVTTKFKVDASLSIMYSLEGILVSDSHLMKYNEKWIRVSNHPNAKKVAFYDKPFLYCLNTTQKVILVDKQIFTDWDEEIANEFPFNKTKIGCGFHENTPISLQEINKNNKKNINICEINIGDILEKGEKVIGIVEIDGSSLKEHYSLDLGIHGKIFGAGNLYYLSDLVKNRERKSQERKRQEKEESEDKEEKIFFHLLTDTQRFSVKKHIFYDYNASVDRVLDKI
jgi:hypothetical protein